MGQNRKNLDLGHFCIKSTKFDFSNYCINSSYIIYALQLPLEQFPPKSLDLNQFPGKPIRIPRNPCAIP
jgi:hypothetical protein